jgi:hypothetical protein
MQPTVKSRETVPLTGLFEGYGDLRGLMLYEQVAPLSLMLQEDYDTGNINREQLVAGLV